MIMKKRILQSESTRKNVSKETLDGYIKTLKKMVDCKTVYNQENTNKEKACFRREKRQNMWQV